MEQQPTRGYRFADFALDLARRRLSRGDTEVITLSGRAFDVLAYLVERRDRMVGKRELMDAVWPRVVVEENNLTQAISSLRKALGDSRESPRFIVTVAGRGYQFVGDVSPLTPDSGSVPAVTVEPPSPAAERASGSRRQLLLALGAVVAVAAGGGLWWHRSRSRRTLPESIAVLPFKPLLSGSSDPAVEIGVTELLINRLSSLPGAVVRPLSSVRRYVALELDPLQAGRELGVAAVVDGYVQIQGDSIRLTARLLDVGTGASLWAGNYTERLGDFFAVQDALATQLVNALAIDVPPETRRRLLAHGTTDAEAWQLYANGRYQLERRNADGLQRAREFFQAAVARDAQFALALTGLSEAWALAGVFTIEPPDSAFNEARRAAQRALEIDPQLPQALVALGHVETQYDRDLASARRRYNRAIELAPGYAWAHLFLALNATQANQVGSALDSVARAQALEPASLPFMALGGFIQYFTGQFDAARDRLARIVESAPEAILPRQFLARVLLMLGDAPAVVRLLEGRNGPAPGSMSNLGRAYAQVGNEVGARDEIARVESLGAQGFGVGFDLALLHLSLGERHRALDSLERAVGDHSQMAGYVNVEPALGPIRGEVRFNAIAQRIGVA